MSRLILVRHAQATLSRDPTQAFQDYDRLSPLGVRQANHLGEELVSSGAVFDRVFVGPATRHRQTADAVAAAYARLTVPWPEPVTVEELGEHQGARVVQLALEEPDYDEELVRLRAQEADATETDEQTRAYLRAFRHVTRQWVRGELPPALVVEETWQIFRARVKLGIRAILDGAGRGDTVGVFTSGGPIGSTVASVLGLGDEDALEFAWVVDNATLTECLFSGARVSLKSFNVQPRVGSAEFYTHV